MPPPLLAADVEKLIGFAVFVVYVLGWLFKMTRGRNQNAPPVATRPRPVVRPRNEKLQEEIDMFLQEVGPKKPPQRPRTPERPVVPAKTAGQKIQQPAARVASRPAPRRVRPGQEVASRHLPDPEKSVGDAVQQHLQRHMGERVAKETAAHLQHSVDQGVVAHLGQLAAPPRAAISASATQPVSAVASAAFSGARLAELFHDPASLRQAIVVSLILSPPPGRKPRIAY